MASVVPHPFTKPHWFGVMSTRLWSLELVCTLTDIPLALSDGHGCAGCPGMGRLVLGHNSVEQVGEEGCSTVPEGFSDPSLYIVWAGCFASFHLLNGQLHLCNHDQGD